MADSLEKDDLLKQVRSWFIRAYRGREAWLKEKNKAGKLYDGEHWTQEEKQILRDRGQPDVVYNRIKGKIDSLVGKQIRRKTNVRAYDRGSGDFQAAKAITEALRYWEYHSDFDFQEKEAHKDQLIDGIGWYKTDIVWDGLDADFDTKQVWNEDIFPDPTSRRPDLSDAKYICQSIWMHLEDAQELFPDFASELDSLVNNRAADLGVGDPALNTREDQYSSHQKSLSGGQESAAEEELFIDKKLKRIRITECWYRTPYRRTFIVAAGQGGAIETTGMSDSDIEKASQAFEKVVEFSQLGFRLHKAIFAWNTILEHQKNQRDYDREGKFPYVPVWGYRERSTDRLPYGAVRQMEGPQLGINKRQSKILHLISTNQVIAEKGVVTDIDHVRNELAKPDAYVELLGPGRFEVQRNLDISQVHYQMLQEDKKEIQMVGIGSEIQGVSRATSGRDFALREEEAENPIAEIYMNLRWSKRQVALQVVDFIQQFWTEERFVRLTDDPDDLGVVLNRRVIDPQTGEVFIENNLALGKYDLIIDETPESLNLRSEQFSQLISFAKELGVPIPLDQLIKSSSLPNKNELLNAFRQQQQQPAPQEAAATQ